MIATISIATREDAEALEKAAANAGYVFIQRASGSHALVRIPKTVREKTCATLQSEVSTNSLNHVHPQNKPQSAPPNVRTWWRVVREL